MSTTTRNGPRRAPTSLTRVIVFGLSALGVGFGGFLAWGFTAPVDSAAIAPGTVAVLSQRKTVEHLEGGIVRAIHVADGDLVRTGQLLVELDATASAAQLDQLESQLLAQNARAERLRAEQANVRELSFSADVEAAARRSPELASVVETERRLFESRWSTYDGRLAVNGARVDQLRQEIRALEAQAVARREQIAIRNEEKKKFERLAKKGYESTTRIIEQRLEIAELTGEREQLLAEAAKAEQAIEETELSSIALGNERLDAIHADLASAQGAIAELKDRRRALADVVGRRSIVAPIEGKVTDLRVFTLGGVIGPGEPVLDIVPTNDDLIVEALVDPKDIDTVRVGLHTQVRLTAYRSRITPSIAGEVTHVSADMLTDDNTGEPYFLTKVRLDEESFDSVGDLVLYPGMPAEVIIVTGARKAIDYLLAPVTDSMNRAFRED